MPKLRKGILILFTLVTLSGFLLDVITKNKVFSEKGSTIAEVIPGILRFHKTTNRGIVFGVFKDFDQAGLIFTIIGLIAVPIIIVIFLFIKNKTWSIATSLAFILAGTMGNTFDRIMSSENSVRDFIYVYSINFPIFNLADSFILLGTIVLCIELFLFEEPKKKPKSLSRPISTNVEIANLSLKNPIMVASGTFGGIFDRLIDINKLGGIVLKTVTLEPRKGNEPPRIAETSSGMLNSIGLENKGLEGFINDELQFYSKFDTRLVVNIAGKTIDEFAFMAKRLAEFKRIDAIELNISCPNVSGGLDFGTNPDHTKEVVRRVKESIQIPVIAKLTPNVTSVVEIAQAAVDGGADALSLVNTFKGMAVDWKKKEPKLGAITGGLSGPAIKPIALRIVWEVKCAIPHIPIIGIGGITTVDDALEFICAGATCVQIGTANFVDPSTTVKIIDELPFVLNGNNITDIKTLIGAISAKPTHVH